MQGIRINGRIAPSKKAVKEAVKADPSGVRLVATSLMENEFDGPVSNAPAGVFNFVGPDEHRNRKFYGNIKVSIDGQGGRSIRVT